MSLLNAGNVIVAYEDSLPTSRNIRLNRAYAVGFRIARIADQLVDTDLFNVHILYEFMLEHFYEVFFGFNDIRRIMATFTVTVNPQVGVGREVGSRGVHVFDDQSFNPEMILEMISENMQSGDEFHFEDFEYSFVFSVDSYRFGAGSDTFMQCEFSKVDKGTELSYEDDHGTLSCLAVALAYNLVRYERTIAWKERYDAGLTRKKSPNTGFTKLKTQVIQRARQLMDDFDWEPIVPSIEIHRFVDRYPEFRVALFARGAEHPTVFTHPDYEPEAYDGFLKTNRSERQRRSRQWRTFYLGWYMPRGKDYGHFCSIREQDFTKTSLKFCHECLKTFYTNNRNAGYGVRNNRCLCEPLENADQQRPDRGETRKKMQRAYPCTYCNQTGHGERKCPKRCKNCYHNHAPDDRCLLSRPTTPITFWTEEQQFDEKGDFLPKLWAYDIEAMMVDHPEKVTKAFRQDDQGQFVKTRPGEHGVCTFTIIKRPVHKMNLLIMQEVFSGESKTFYDMDAFMDYLRLIQRPTKPDGKPGKQAHYLFAHNAAGYDNRILYNYMIDHIHPDTDPVLEIIPQGAKILQFKWGDNLVFRDTLRFLPGSLDRLAKELLRGKKELRKGCFPHLFNVAQNQNYEGSLPDLEYFDLLFMKSKSDVDTFLKWHAENKNKTWNFKNELYLYCKNDVEILAEIMKSFHHEFVSIAGASPWSYTTMPGFIHRVVLNDMFENQIGSLSEDIPTREMELRAYVKEYWAALKPVEYWYCRAALQGGRTEVRDTFTEVKRDSGSRIVYIDVTSMYPYVQLVRDFPVGTPRIEIYNQEHVPCIECTKPKYSDANYNRPNLVCTCGLPPDFRISHMRNNGIDIQMEQEPTQESFMENDDYFGFVCVDVEVDRNVFVPPIISHDHNRHKCMAMVGLHRELYIPTPELKKALNHGARIVKFHSMHIYKKAPGIWCNVLKKYYILKLKNSQNKPPEEQWEAYAAQYAKFGMKEAIMNSLKNDEWGLNPFRKMMAKIVLNSGWGKHCQRPNMLKTTNYAPNDSRAFFDMVNRNMQHQEKLKNVSINHNGVITTKSVDLETYASKDFKENYLPAGCMVPSYGRMMFLDKVMQLKDPERQLLMHDTDSIVYLQEPGDPDIVEGFIHSL